MVLYHSDRAGNSAIFLFFHVWHAFRAAQLRVYHESPFPMQGNGAEMLRLACCLVTEWGINVCAPIHDALLVEGPATDIEAIVSRTQEAMREASVIGLGGFELRTDAKVVRYPDRYIDDRGRVFFERVIELLNTLNGADT